MFLYMYLNSLYVCAWVRVFKTSFSDILFPTFSHTLYFWNIQLIHKAHMNNVRVTSFYWEKWGNNLLQFFYSYLSSCHDLCDASGTTVFLHCPSSSSLIKIKNPQKNEASKLTRQILQDRRSFSEMRFYFSHFILSSKKLNLWKIMSFPRPFHKKRF